jgi:hypothetical protein
MHSKEFTKLANDIVTHRKNGWTKTSREGMHLLVKAALEKGQITKEEYAYLIKMIGDANTPPPPPPPGEESKRKKKNKLGNT